MSHPFADSPPEIFEMPMPEGFGEDWLVICEAIKIKTGREYLVSELVSALALKKLLEVLSDAEEPSVLLAEIVEELGYRLPDKNLFEN